MFAVIGDGMLAGKMPYLDLWDVKPPGIFMVFAAAQALFGRNMASVRIVEVIGVLGMVAAFLQVAHAIALPRVAGLMGASLATLVYAQLGFWHTSQPEAFGGILTAFALAVGAYAWKRVSGPAISAMRPPAETTVDTASEPRAASNGLLLLGAWLMIGVLFGAAFLLKPNLAVGAVVCSLAFSWLMWVRTRRLGAVATPILVMGVGAALPIVLVVAWIVARHAGPALYWTLFEFAPGYTKLGWTVSPLILLAAASLELALFFSFLLPVGVIAMWTLPPLAVAERPMVKLILAIVVLHVFGIAAQAKGFDYHFGATLPMVSFVAGIGLYKLWKKAVSFGARGVLLFIAVFVILDVSRTPLYQATGLLQKDVEQFWPSSWDRLVSFTTGKPSREKLDAKLYKYTDYNVDDNRTVGRYIARRTAPEDKIYVWGFEPGIYWFANRAPASRYVINTPQRTTWQQQRGRKELLDDLHASRPRVIVVQRSDVMPWVTGDKLDSRAVLATFPELKALLATRYRFTQTLRDFDLYERR
jgi:hypothetical protein